MARYSIAADRHRDECECDNCDNCTIQEYKILGSSDTYTVQYNSGHIIKATKEKYQEPINKWFETEYEYSCGIPNHKNCTKKFPLNDIREIDNEGKFGMPNKNNSKQLR